MRSTRACIRTQRLSTTPSNVRPRRCQATINDMAPIGRKRVSRSLLLCPSTECAPDRWCAFETDMTAPRTQRDRSLIAPRPRYRAPSASTARSCARWSTPNAEPTCSPDAASNARSDARQSMARGQWNTPGAQARALRCGSVAARSGVPRPLGRATSPGASAARSTARGTCPDIPRVPSTRFGSMETTRWTCTYR